MKKELAMIIHSLGDGIMIIEIILEEDIELCQK